MVDLAVIIAAGTQHYHSQLMNQRPWAVLPTLGKPMVVRVMDRLYRAGIERYVVIVGDTEGEVAGYLSKLWKPNVTVEFELKNSTTSLHQALVKIARRYQQPFLVTTYNSFSHNRLPESLRNQHQQNENQVILTGATTTLSLAQEHYYAVTDAQQVYNITEVQPADEKAYILSDLAIIGKDMVQHLSSSPERLSAQQGRQLLGIIQAYVRGGGAARMVESAWTLHVEQDADVLTINKYLLEEGQDAHILSELPYTVQIVPPVRIDPQVSVGQGAKIGPFVYLEHGCRVGHRATLSNVVVFGDATVNAEETVTNALITPRGRISASMEDKR